MLLASRVNQLDVSSSYVRRRGSFSPEVGRAIDQGGGFVDENVGDDNRNVDRDGG